MFLEYFFRNGNDCCNNYYQKVEDIILTYASTFWKYCFARKTIRLMQYIFKTLCNVMF